MSVKPEEKRDEGQQGGSNPDAPGKRREYRPPRIVKKRAVARATLFGGGGPASDGDPVIGAPG